MNRIQKAVLLSVTFLVASLGIIYISPRFDWITLLLFILLSIVLSSILIKAMKKHDEKLGTEADRLIQLLQRIDNGEEKLSLHESPLSKLEDEIIKSMVEKTRTRDAAIKSKLLLKTHMEDITHQIKTPLTGILLLLDLLKEDDENREEYISMIRRDIDRLNHLSDLLLKLASLDAGTIHMEFKPFPAKELLLDCELIVETLLIEKDISLIYHGEDMTIMADRIWIFEAIVNLLKNAIEISQRESEIEITMAQNNIYQSIIVSDSGGGILPEKVNLIFKRFYKLDPTSRGFGIGLPMVKAIMDEHGGKVLVRNSSKGSDFELRFYRIE